MSNKQIIKKVFDEEFDSKRMKQQILTNYKRKEKNRMIKYLKYALPICIIVIISGVLSLNLLTKERQLEEPKEKINIFENLEGKNIITSTAISDKLISEDFASLVNYSDAIVKGKVLSVNFEELDGNAWTKIKFHVDEIFKGDIKVNEDIEIHFIGGYITLENHIKINNDAFRFETLSADEIKNTILKEVIDGEDEFVKKGEELILCIVKTPDYLPFPKNSYERLFASGMLKERGNKYVQLYGEIEEKYSVDKDKLKDIKKLVGK